LFGDTSLDSGYYAACTALKTQTQALEFAANNIANVNTSGYRGQIPSFQSLLAGLHSGGTSGWNRLINEFSVLNGARLDLRQGNLEPTGNPLDFAIQGPGFFAAQTPAGTLYTRNGSFRVAAKGQLVSASGDPILGATGPIAVPAGPVSISADGTVSVNGAVVGTLRIAEFSAASSLTPAGGSYYSAATNDAKPALRSSVQQGMIESSNVNPITAMVGLISAQRQTEMIERAMTAFYADFNRIAADELPRI
jgi:flagellar basal-body rod protein FlgF/flagellar basal-body rod protein FlgG